MFAASLKKKKRFCHTNLVEKIWSLHLLQPPQQETTHLPASACVATDTAGGWCTSENQLPWNIQNGSSNVLPIRKHSNFPKVEVPHGTTTINIDDNHCFWSLWAFASTHVLAWPETNPIKLFVLQHNPWTACQKLSWTRGLLKVASEIYVDTVATRYLVQNPALFQASRRGQLGIFFLQ